MTTLATNEPRAFEAEEIQSLNDLPMVASDIIYEGAAVGDNGSGISRPLVAGDVFQGFADRKCDNSAGAASAKNVHVRQKGDIVLSVVGVSSAADEHEVVYATDDNTFTLTSSGGSSIGKVKRWISSTKCVVHFEGASLRSI
jgi:hypothetical protein